MNNGAQSEPPRATLDTALERQAEWSTAAGRLKRHLERWRSTSLILVTGGATLEVLAAKLRTLAGWNELAPTLAYAGVVALALVPIIRLSKLGSERIRDWTRARSASEALKKEIYSYLTRTAEYQAKDRGQKLNEAVAQILDEVQDLTPYAALAAGWEPKKLEFLDMAGYIEHRLNEQIKGFYRPRAASLARRLHAFKSIEFALTVSAAAFAALAAYTGLAGFAAWVPVLTTAGGAVLAHSEASRFERLVLSYTATANRLEGIRNAWLDRHRNGDASPAERTEFVRACEDAISVENEGWMAEWMAAPS